MTKPKTRGMKRKSRRSKSGRIMAIVIAIAILLLIASILIFRSDGSGKINSPVNTNLNSESTNNSSNNSSTSQSNKTLTPSKLPNSSPTSTAKTTAKPIPTPAPAPLGVTLAQYNQTKTGMGIADVVEVFGVEGAIVSSNPDSYTITYKWDGSGSKGASITITFVNNQLSSKSQSGLK
jgi:cytoskeletal protein RodZ